MMPAFKPCTVWLITAVKRDVDKCKNDVFYVKLLIVLVNNALQIKFSLNVATRCYDCKAILHWPHQLSG